MQSNKVNISSSIIHPFTFGCAVLSLLSEVIVTEYGSVIVYVSLSVSLICVCVNVCVCVCARVRRALR